MPVHEVTIQVLSGPHLIICYIPLMQNSMVCNKTDMAWFPDKIYCWAVSVKYSSPQIIDVNCSGLFVRAVLL